MSSHLSDSVAQVWRRQPARRFGTMKGGVIIFRGALSQNGFIKGANDVLDQCFPMFLPGSDCKSKDFEACICSATTCRAHRNS
jgi:hypothetical protein